MFSILDPKTFHWKTDKKKQQTLLLPPSWGHLKRTQLRAVTEVVGVQGVRLCSAVIRLRFWTWKHDESEANIKAAMLLWVTQLHSGSLLQEAKCLWAHCMWRSSKPVARPAPVLEEHLAGLCVSMTAALPISKVQHTVFYIGFAFKWHFISTPI